VTRTSRTLRPLAALAIVTLIGAGCSDGSAENGNTGTGTGSSENATNRDKAMKFAECMRQRRQRVPGPGRFGRVDR